MKDPPDPLQVQEQAIHTGMFVLKRLRVLFYAVLVILAVVVVDRVHQESIKSDLRDRIADQEQRLTRQNQAINNLTETLQANRIILDFVQENSDHSVCVDTVENFFEVALAEVVLASLADDELALVTSTEQLLNSRDQLASIYELCPKPVPNDKE